MKTHELTTITGRRLRETTRVAVLCGALLLALSGCGSLITSTTSGRPTKADSSATSATDDGPKPVRVAAGNVATAPGGEEPKAVISVYEDFLCPACASFEKMYGPSITQLIDSGAAAVDYYAVSILDSSRTDHYSSRAGAAAYCVADADVETYRRFHAALYARQPSEMGSSFPTDDQLIETARQAGAVDGIADCVNEGRYLDMVTNLAAAEDVSATPTMRINGEDYEYSTPDALVAKVEELAR